MNRLRVLGEVEQLVLLAVLRLHEEAYPVRIRNEIRARAGVELARGTIYVTLDRLERRGYLHSRFGDPTPERGGKAKRYFRLTARARTALRRSQRALVNLWVETELSPGRP